MNFYTKITRKKAKKKERKMGIKKGMDRIGNKNIKITKTEKEERKEERGRRDRQTDCNGAAAVNTGTQRLSDCNTTPE
jgi:hypothetical protein